MIKNILSILIFDVVIEQLFSMKKDLVTYWRNRFYEDIIKNIMIFKKMLNLKKINKNQHVSLIVFNFLMNDEMSKKLLNESTKWINENDEFVDINDVHDQNDVDSILNDANSLAVELGFGQKFKPDPRVDVRPGWTDQSSQPDLRVDVRRILSSLSETSYI
jgi:hypothetical protein